MIRHLTLAHTGLFIASATLRADVLEFESKPVERRIVTSADDTSTLTVSIKRIDRETLQEVRGKDDIVEEVWLGDQRLPLEILYLRPTIVTSFQLTIDGKKIPIPARFWNDLGGLPLSDVVINRKPKTENEQFELQEFMTRIPGPVIERSADGGTVLISWTRPEE